MAILADDIKLLKSDIMSDVNEGGGGVTGGVIVDGVSNNMFDDISTLDRVYGAVHLRKAFGSVQTATQDKYYGAHAIISKLPGDTKLGVNLFNTGDWFDRRPAAASRVENYRAQGPMYSGFLWGTQYMGSRVITIFQSTTAPLPGVGDVLRLVAAVGSQYIRIVNLSYTDQEFTDTSGTFTRRILVLELSDVLSMDFVGVEINRLDTLTPNAKIYKTVVANAARYYSARPLALAASLGDYQIKVDSVYSQVVPASQAEVAIVDETAGGNSSAVFDSSAGLTSFATSVTFAANVNIYLGSPCFPGSLSIPVAGGTIVDDAGTLKIGATSLGSIDYAAGTLTFSASAPSYTGTKTVSYKPAVAPIRLADTASLAVTAANRGYVWTITLPIPPQPKSLKVMYRALSEWYELNDNGNGGLIGAESGIGSGTISYITGTASVTLGAMPDVDSEIIFAWESAADIYNRTGIAPDNAVIKHQLAQTGIDKSTFQITWNDGTARTITCNADGTLTGYGTGRLKSATGEVEFMPTTLPLGGTTFTFNYQYGTKIEEIFNNPTRSSQNLDITLANTAILAGSVEVEWNLFTANAVSEAINAWVSPNITAYDDGVGALTDFPGSSIDYVNGRVIWDPDIGQDVPKPIYRYGTMGRDNTGFNVFRKMLETINYLQLPSIFPINGTGVVKIRYRAADTPTAAQETLLLSEINLDLTPQYAETILQSSVRFTFGGKTYIDRLGILYHSVDPATGAGTYAGTIDYSTGSVTLSSWATGASNVMTLNSLATSLDYRPVDQAVFRVPIAPVKTQSLQVRATPVDGGGQITAISDAQGNLLTGDMDGHIDYESGVVNIRFGAWVVAAGNEAEPWYDPLAIRGDGKIFQPRSVLADTIIYNAVSYRYLPLSAAILGLDAVRLPADGRVPIYSPGDVVVVLNDQTTTGTFTSGTTTDLGRVRLAKAMVRDLGGNALDVAKYSVNLDTGILTWGDLAGVSQPLTITDRIEDMAVLTDVQITGQLALSQPLSHAFPLAGTLVANAIIWGTLYARTSVPFDQQTWTNVWSDSLIGSSVSAQYNNTQYPIAVDNRSAIQERWAIVFTSASNFNVVGEHVGQIATGNIAVDCAPINPNTGWPYFTIPYQGWGSGWSAGNVLRFNTYAANAPLWVIQSVAQGEAAGTDYTFCLEVRGDIDTP